MTLTLAVPGSKSMTQRALMIAALCHRPVIVSNFLDCDDSAYLRQILMQLGTVISGNGNDLEITPAERIDSKEVLFCGNAGTTMRFASCLSLLTDEEILLDGNDRMRQRPVHDLGVALTSLGIRVRYLNHQGYPPWALCREVTVPREVTVDCSRSSQFGSGLMMVAPCLENGLTIHFSGERVSRPYLQMTASMMEQAGACLNWLSEDSIQIFPGGYKPSLDGFCVEPDWSSAAFVLAAARLTDRDVQIPGLRNRELSLQGDSGFPEIMAQLDHDEPIEINLSGTPDLIAPLVPLCLFGKQPVRIRGVAHARIKECDRPAVLAREFQRIGARIIECPDGLDITPVPLNADVEMSLNPEEDHRMAMAFALVSLRLPKLRSLDESCVSKSFPDFYQLLENFR